MVHTLDKINQPKQYNDIHKNIIKDLYNGENLIISQNRGCFVSTILIFYCLNKIKENPNILINYCGANGSFSRHFVSTLVNYGALFNLDGWALNDNIDRDVFCEKNYDISIFDGMYGYSHFFSDFFKIKSKQKIFTCYCKAAITQVEKYGSFEGFNLHTLQAESVYTKEELEQIRKTYDTSIHDDWNESDYLKDYGDLTKDHSLPREAYHRGLPELDDYLASL